jgi:hypothetical protein
MTDTLAPGQCIQPVAAEEVDGEVHAWCYTKACGWEKRYSFPETGIALKRLQDDHDGVARYKP